MVNARRRPLCPQERDPVPVVQEAAWTLGPVWKGAENLAPIGIRSPDCPARIESLYDYAIPSHTTRGEYPEFFIGKGGQSLRLYIIWARFKKMSLKFMS